MINSNVKNQGFSLRMVFLF